MNEKNICWIIKFYLVDFVKNFMKNFKGLQIMFWLFSFSKKEYSVSTCPDLSNIKAFSFLERKLFYTLGWLHKKQSGTQM